MVTGTGFDIQGNIYIYVLTYNIYLYVCNIYVQILQMPWIKLLSIIYLYLQERVSSNVDTSTFSLSFFFFFLLSLLPILKEKKYCPLSHYLHIPFKTKQNKAKHHIFRQPHFCCLLEKGGAVFALCTELLVSVWGAQGPVWVWLPQPSSRLYTPRSPLQG
jgi:hypothetical protein